MQSPVDLVIWIGDSTTIQFEVIVPIIRRAQPDGLIPFESPPLKSIMDDDINGLMQDYLDFYNSLYMEGKA